MWTARASRRRHRPKRQAGGLPTAPGRITYGSVLTTFLRHGFKLNDNPTHWQRGVSAVTYSRFAFVHGSDVLRRSPYSYVASTVVLARIYLLRAQGARGAAGQVQARWRRKVTRALPPARRPGSHIAEPTHRGPGAPRRGDAHPPAPPRSASRRVSVSVSRESGRKRSHSTLTRRRRRVTTAARSERRQTIRRFPDSGAWTNRCTTWHVHSCLTSPGSPDSRLRLPGRLHGLRQAPASCETLRLSQSHSPLWPGLFHHFMRSH